MLLTRSKPQIAMKMPHPIDPCSMQPKGNRPPQERWSGGHERKRKGQAPQQ